MSAKFLNIFMISEHRNHLRG